MFDLWVAGYANGVSGGITTAIRREDVGEIQEGNHAFLWNMGNLAGVSASFVLNFAQPAALAAQMGGTKWVTSFATGLDVAGGGFSAFESARGLADGQWDYSDTFNLLSFAPFGVAAVANVKNSIGTIRSAHRMAGSAGDAVAGSADEVLRSSQRTEVTVTGACFVAGTEILTADGEEEIEDIEVGDWVLADDPTTPGEVEYKQVLETFVRQTDTLVDLYVDGEVISTTEEHPFWVPDKGWVEAKDLTVGSLLQTEEGTVVDVDKIEKREGEFEVYNFKVEDFHTYFVSDLGLLVHNTCNEPWMPPNPNDDIDYQNLKKSYASEEQLNEPGVYMAGVPGKPQVKAAPRLAAQYGGNPEDWVKKSSLSYEGVKDIHIETHWFENLVTGQKVEKKTVINPHQRD